MSAPEQTEGRAPTEPLKDAAPASQMAGLGFDALEERLRELRGSLGLPDAPLRNAVAALAPVAAPVPVPVPAPRPVPRPVREERAETVLRTPRIGWDLVGLAVAWAGLIALVIGLAAGSLG